jgi:hypothetical protein
MARTRLHLISLALGSTLTAGLFAVGAGLSGHHSQPGEQRPGEAAKGGGHAMPPDMEKQMQEWMELMKPGPNHELLASMAGEYTTTMRFWPGGPGTPAMESKGTSRQRMVLGGRHLLQEFEGNMMGSPFSGMGLSTWDNVRKQFVGTWADSVGGAILYLTGGLSPDRTTITQFATMDEPMTGEFGKIVKYVTKIVDKDTIHFTAYEVMYGDEFKVFEIEYKRVK